MENSKRGEKRFHCGHCGEKISKSLYFEHKRLYYSSHSNTWDEVQVTKREEPFEDFTFSDSEPEGQHL